MLSFFLTAKNNKYVLIVIDIIFLMVIWSLVGFSEINFGVFAGDIALLVTVVIFIQEIKKVKRNKNSKEILQHESPTDWVKACTKFSVSSLLSSLVYAIVNGQTLTLGDQPIFNYLFYFGIVFFLMGILYTVRIIWFIIDPSSPANILAGKILNKISRYGFRAVFLAFIASLQALNGIMLYYILFGILVLHTSLNILIIIYLPTLILSFIAMVPQVHTLLFHFEEKMRLRDSVTIVCFYSPWIVLASISLLIKIGIISL